ncbi:hypothetical protein JJB07_10255 [Tumebacillus sp. ITR2]|uniref:Prepilin-type N-terminal cleavage/methylation domain-containing protein n=1 Tax=Tumebacillus amylolyticus TaxID=2801339 RepID=A0ABS1J9T8_9BACL|nr:hypothetical protein [Tumebacillus amylolyticus]MBL0387032.1 hypothetical protein [Tumebacillus amylolyticus]
MILKKQNEQGFVLLETLLALFLLSLALLLAVELWQASAAQERRAQLHLVISRLALSTLEQARIQNPLPIGTSLRDVTSQLSTAVPVTETTVVSFDPTSGLTKINLTYTWQEGGHPFVQNWAALYR